MIATRSVCVMTMMGILSMNLILTINGQGVTLVQMPGRNCWVLSNQFVRLVISGEFPSISSLQGDLEGASAFATELLSESVEGCRCGFSPSMSSWPVLFCFLLTRQQCGEWSLPGGEKSVVILQKSCCERALPLKSPGSTRRRYQTIKWFQVE